MTSQQAAVGLALLSAVAYAAAAVAQERAAVQHSTAVPHSRIPRAVALTGVGAALHGVALHFGSVGVVQALGTLTLLAALPIHAFARRVRVVRAAWWHAGLTAAGLTCVIALAAEPARPAALTAGQTAALVAVTVAGASALACLAWAARGPRPRALLLAVAAGSAFGAASVLGKSELARLGQGGPPGLPAAAAIVVLALAGFALSQRSYRGAGLAAPLAAASVANPVAATLAGALLLGDGFRFGPAGTALAVLGALAAGCGVAGLAVLRHPAARSAPALPTRSAVTTAGRNRPQLPHFWDGAPYAARGLTSRR